MTKKTIWVVDDEKSVRSYLGAFLASRGYDVECFETGDSMIARLVEGGTPSVVLLDVLMPGADGVDVLERLKKINPSVPAIMLSCVGQTKTVVEAMKMGAADYLCKPFEDEELDLALENVSEKRRLRDEVQSLRRQVDLDGEAELSSSHSRMRRIREIVSLVADADVPVLICGESGVGKEVVARMIQMSSNRSDRPFVKVNCAALPRDLLESELFGYERGAFTGAVAEKPGKFELAGSGMILLDEIGDMDPMLQAKLLHVLQDGEYSRLGGKRSMRNQARVLASTNRRLEDIVARGDFREDLYFRLNVIRIEIPPLRERREDIPLLANHLFNKYRHKYNSLVEQLPAALVEAFQRHDWPGNVRQLENAVKRFLILADLDLALAELNQQLSGPVNILNGGDKDEALSLKEIGARAAERAEREVILRVLDETNWNRKMAARKLNICYKAFRNKLKKWRIDGPRRAGTSGSGDSDKNLHAMSA